MARIDRKSTRLNSSHLVNSYAVFCLKKQNRSEVQEPHHSAPATRDSLPSTRHPRAARASRAPARSRVGLLRATPFPALFFFNDTATTEIYTLSLHDALPI